MSPKPRFLVTGTLGWLGKRLVRLLADGTFAELAGEAPPLRCLVLPGQDAAELKALGPFVEIVAGDLRRTEDCRAFTRDAAGAVLIHAAGIIHPRRVKEFYEINLEGTAKLLEAAQAANLRRAVVVSSNSPIGCNRNADETFDEASPYHPYMNYGRSKMQMELRAKEIASRGSMELVVVRAPWFYGPDQPPRQTLFFQMIKEGKFPLVGDGRNKRSMAYIDNLCQGLVRCAAIERAAGQTYWIGDRRPYSMNEIIETIERLLETEFGVPVAHRRLRLPYWVGTAAEAADGLLQSVGLYNQKFHVLSEMNKTIACRIDKAEAELSYRPEVALEEGMRRSLRWCRDQGIPL